MIELFETLKKIEAVMMKASTPKLHEFGFSKPELFILMHIHNKKSAHMTKLAKALDIPASSVTNMVDRLEKKNLVVRKNDSNDRRGVMVCGTPELEDTVARIFRICNETFAELLKPVPEDFLKQTVAALDRLYGYLSAENNEKSGGTPKNQCCGGREQQV